MFDNETIDVLNVFLASPSDVKEEREIVEKVVEEINKMRSIDWYIKLLRWENTRPGHGRPQEIINKRDVDQADLFIGLLWRKWGQPTGEYSSGFEEEYFRAKERREETGSPEIWLLFKKLQQEARDDPGKELQRVLNFKEEQERSNEVLYKKFANQGDLEKKIRRWLIDYLLEISRTTTRREAEQASENALPQKNSTASSSDSLTNKENNFGIEQLTQLVRFVSTIIENGELGLGRFEGDKEDKLFYITRLFLFADTLVSKSHTDGLMDNHEINLLYRFKERIEFTPTEKYYIFRTLIGASDNNVPGWFWFKDRSTKEVQEITMSVLLNDSNTRVRKNGVKLLKLLKIVPSKGQMEKLLSDSSLDVKKEALSYVQEIRTTKFLPLIETCLEDSDSNVQKKAQEVKLTLIAKNNSNRAFSKLMEESIKNPKDVLNSISESEVKRKLLLESLKNSEHSKHIRIFAVQELIKRNALPVSLAFELLDSGVEEIELKCYRYLVHNEESVSLEKIENNLEGGLFFSNKEEIILSLFRTYDRDRLEERMHWYDPNSALRYKALGLIMDRKNKIRNDLRDNFGSLEEKLKERSRSKILEEDTEGSNKKENDDKLGGLKEYDSFLRQNYVYAALSVLAEKPESDDIEFARKYVDSSRYEIQLKAVEIIEAVGDETDLDSLIQISKGSFGQLKDLATKTALDMLENEAQINVINNLVETNDRNLINQAIEYAKQADLDICDTADKLLTNDDLLIRREALSYLFEKKNLEELKDLLSRYLDNSKYYYNVVCWLDRIIYGQDEVKEAFLEKINK